VTSRDESIVTGPSLPHSTAVSVELMLMAAGTVGLVEVECIFETSTFGNSLDGFGSADFQVDVV
jgi:hypothetical protein